MPACGVSDHEDDDNNNSIQADLETLLFLTSISQMHLVHIRHGLDKSKIGFNSDSVAVVAVLIEVSRSLGGSNEMLNCSDQSGQTSFIVSTSLSSYNALSLSPNFE